MLGLSKKWVSVGIWGQAVKSFKMELDNLGNCLCDNGCMQQRNSTPCFSSHLTWDLQEWSIILDPNCFQLLWLLGSRKWILYAGNVSPWASAAPYDTQRNNLLPNLKKVDSFIRWICTTQLTGQDKYRGLKGKDCLSSVENKSWPIYKG